MTPNSPPNPELTAQHRADLLGGVTVIRGKAAVNGSPVDLMAIRYYAWDNRESGPMAVWLAEDPE